VATNHSAFERPEALETIASRAAPDCLLVDPWNAIGSARVFSYVREALKVPGAA
jgi:UDP-N-acetyl-D-mannosaminuronic acid dehydrogenase